MSGEPEPVTNVQPAKGGRSPGPVGISDSPTFPGRGPAGFHLVQQRGAQQITPTIDNSAVGPATLLERTLASLTTGYTFTADQLSVLREALRAFADPQQNVFVDSGVRFWPVGSLPPNLTAVISTPADPEYGHYIVKARTIRIRTNYWRRHVVTHELAHAWDRLRGRGQLQSFIRLSAGPLRRATNAEEGNRAWSETSLATAYQSYRSTLLRRFGRNGNPTQNTYSMAFDALRGYSFMHNVREFYAEGYAIFHFGSEFHRTKLYAFARPLYNNLRDEAQADGLPVPNEGALRQRARQDRLIQ